MRQQLQQILKSDAFRNSSWSVLESLLYPLALLIATPLFIQYLGLEQYGIWMLTNSILLSMGVLNIGLSDATIKYVSKYRSQANMDKVAKIIRMNLSIYLLLIFIIVFVAYLLTIFLQAFEWQAIDTSNSALLIDLIMIGSLTLGLKMVEQLILSAFKGFERYDKAAKLSILSRMLLLGTQLTIVLMGYDLKMVFLSMAVVLSLMIGIQLWALKSFFSTFRLAPYFNADSFREIFPFGFWSWIQSMVIIGAGQIDKFIVTHFAGLTVLAYYSLGVMIYQQLHNVFAAAAAWLFPRVSEKTETQEDIRPIFHQARFLLLSLGAGSILLLYLISDVLFEAWLGTETYANSQLFLFGFLAYESLMVMSIVPYYFLIGSGRIRLNSMLEVAFKILNVACMILFYQWMGIAGIVYGLMFASLLFLPFQNRIIMRKVFSSKRFWHWKDIGILLPSLMLMLIILAPWGVYRYLLLLPLLLFLKSVYYDGIKGFIHLKSKP